MMHTENAIHKRERERRKREECCHVIAVRLKTEMKWSAPWAEKKEMWIKKRRLSLSLSLFLLLLSLSLSPSFFCSLSPSSLSLSNADILHTLSHTNAPAFTRHHHIQRQERERNLHCPVKNVNIQEEKRKCAKLSLPLISPPSSSSLSSSHSLILSSFHASIPAHLGTRPSEGGMSMS